MPNVQDYLKPIPQVTWDELFPISKKKELPPDGVFELGLVLGGTVSAGAYTAGVLDFLIEALDNWEVQKKKDAAAPNWKITLKAVAGTSGGGVLAATLAKVLAWDFPHVSNVPQAPAVDNPFYHVWVESLDIRRMLSTEDLDGDEKIQSVINSACRFEAANYVAHYSQSPSNTRARGYHADPLPVFLTLTNLKGVPCKVDWGNGLSQAYLNHADYARLAVFIGGGNDRVRPDEFGVSTNPAAGFISWPDAAQFALGTSAFPMGFPLQGLSRPLEHYRYRPWVIPGDGNTVPDKVVPAQIDWSRLATGAQQIVDPTYHFLAADGGVIDNEPVELCRRELAGMLGRNDRQGNLAKRALLLVDPFADAPDLGSEHFTGLPDEASSLIRCMKNQGRYDSQDMLLAGDPNCFSRFMITAKRGSEVGGKAIATACLGAFGGFLSPKFRQHDYFLGRKNCQDFLASAENFWLPEDNPLFCNWLAGQPAAAAVLRKQVMIENRQVWCLPIIPLYGSCLNSQQVPAYPKNAFDPDANWFQELLKSRIDKLMDKANDELVSGFFSKLYLVIGESLGGKGKLLDYLNDKIRDGLGEWKLL